MTTLEQLEQTEQLFHEALERAPAERDGFLAAACAGDEALRRQVAALLAADRQPAELLQTPVFASSAAELSARLLDVEPEATAAPDQRVGPYRLVRELGRGGMGAVYLAVRDDGQFEQQVAVKILKRGLDTEQVLRRFRHERQILANLPHPNIARLFDGGMLADGRPYFVMEYVEGQPISEYADRQRLSLDERLKLFGAVCDAVQYMHQRRVLHRDLKPGNILITNDGVPKLLDFGIAKLLDAQPSATVTPTAFRVMTPEYASPEQLRGLRLTEASDVYSLGVLLYELLTGQRPYQFQSRLPREILQTIQGSDPPRPSVSVAREERRASGEDDASAPRTRATVAHLRRATPDELQRKLRGDLDNVMLMALRQEAERRYATVAQFADDVRRHLAGLPVTARKDTFGYRGAKFFHRHKPYLLATAAIAILCLLLGLALASFLTRPRTKGSIAVLPVTTANRNPQAEFPAGGVTDKQPTANPEAYRLYLKGQLYWNQRTVLGLTTAIEHFEQALAKDPNFALAYSGLANSYGLLGAYRVIQPREAFAKARRAALQAVACDEQLAEAHTSLALVTWLHDWDWAGAERAFRRAIQLNPNYETAPHWFGLYLAEMGRFDEAVAAEQRALELDPKSLFIQADLGRVYYYARRYEEALRHYRRAVELAPNFPAFYAELFFVYEQLGRSDEMIACLEKLGEGNKQLRAVYLQHGIKRVWQIMLRGINHDDPAQAYVVASYHTRLGQPQQALDWLYRAYEARDHQMAQIKVEPLFDGLRADPRFVELMRRMNFTP